MKIFLIFSIYIISTIKANCNKNITVCEGSAVHLQCPQNQGIEITKVFYGRGNNVTCADHWSMPNFIHGCFSASAHDWVSVRCNGNSQCTFEASNSLFSDPCPNVFKYMEVEYKCKPKTVSICEHESYHVRCSPGMKIEVARVFYGRANNVTCFPHWSMGNYKNGCFAQSAFDVVANRCNGLHSCNITASNAIFSDPCPNVFKYFEIEFLCF